MKPLVIFGYGDIAELANYYFKHDSDFDVAGFTVDAAYKKSDTYLNLPLVAFEEITTHFPPEKYDMFIAMSYAKLNTAREQKYLAAKKLGYKLVNYISSHATVLTDLEECENCFILEDNTIQPFVTIGNNVTLWSGNHIGHHSTIKDHCFIASHVVISGGVVIENNAFIGVNVTLRDHITIAEKSVLGAGALIVKDTEAYGIYRGTAARMAKVTSEELVKI